MLNEIINYTPAARLIGLDLSQNTQKNLSKIASCARAKRITRQILHRTRYVKIIKKRVGGGAEGERRGVATTEDGGSGCTTDHRCGTLFFFFHSSPSVRSRFRVVAHQPKRTRKPRCRLSAAVQVCATDDENASASIRPYCTSGRSYIFTVSVIILLHRLERYCTRARARRLATRNYYSHFTGGALSFFFILQHSSRHARRSAHDRRSAAAERFTIGRT